MYQLELHFHTNESSRCGKVPAADGTPLRVYLGMEIRFPNDENDFLVYGIDEGFLEKYPWIYMKELPDLYKIAQKEGLTIVQAHPFRKKCFPGDIECLHGIEIYNGNPRFS